MSVTSRGALAAQIDRLDRAREARRRREPFTDERLTLSHGSGGKASAQLIDGLILPGLGASALGSDSDSATLTLADHPGGRVAFTTDSYVVSPIVFPGGDIGSLAIHGTINDLATAGARPICVSLAFIIEEGLEADVLRQIVGSVGRAAAGAGIMVATGDTKVVPRGKADRLFINTSGIGIVAEQCSLSARHIQVGDKVLLSGSVGEHGIAVMLARDALELEAEISSDSAPLHELVASVLEAAPATRVFKDPTRGGVATSLNEIARQAGLAIAIDERLVPVRVDVRAACEMLGLDPLHIANEGRMIAIVPADEAAGALRAMQRSPHGAGAAVVGEVLEGPADMVLLRTDAGGTRVLDMLVGDPLPRIC